MQFVPVLTVRNPLFRRSLGVPRLPQDFQFQALQFPLLGVEVPHYFPARIFELETADDLRRVCEDALSWSQAVRDDLSSRDPESFSDAELLQVWAADLSCLHLVEVPHSADYVLSLPLSAAHNFPYGRVRDIVLQRLGVEL